MYGWIWRRLPFGFAGKLVGSTVLALVAIAALWYLVFPAVEPLLPFDDAQISEPTDPTPAPPPTR